MHNPIAKAYYAKCLDILRFAEHDREQYLYEAFVRALQAIRYRHSKRLLVRHMHSIRPVLHRIRAQAELDA